MDRLPCPPAKLVPLTFGQPPCSLTLAGQYFCVFLPIQRLSPWAWIACRWIGEAEWDARRPKYCCAETEEMRPETAARMMVVFMVVDWVGVS